jgi:hypothetical protein
LSAKLKKSFNLFGGKLEMKQVLRILSWESGKAEADPPFRL